jgi:serine/threonine protein kinase
MRYERFDRLASGGKAEVFFCRDIVLGRPNALKLLHPQFRKTPLEERLLERSASPSSAKAVK